MNCLVVVNDAPYAGERPYNALRLATALAADQDRTVRLFFLGDGAFCAVREQVVPEGRHDIAWMLNRFLAGGRTAGVCRTCMEERGILPDALIPGASVQTLADLTAWTGEADRLLVF